MFDTLKWIGTSIMVPAIVGIFSAFISFKMNKPKEVIYREYPLMDNFKANEYFPLKVGNWWTYERNIQYINENNKEIKLSDTVTCKVIKSYKIKGAELYLLVGNPFTIEDNADLEIYGYIIISNKVIEVPSSHIEKIVSKFGKNELLENDDITGLSISFEFPLYDKQIFGDANELLFQSSMNAAYVKKEQSFKKQIRDTLIETGLFTINKFYISGDTETSFIPYVGITGHRYEHNGSLSNIQFKLKDYKIADQ